MFKFNNLYMIIRKILIIDDKCMYSQRINVFLLYFIRLVMLRCFRILLSLYNTVLQLWFQLNILIFGGKST